MFLQEIQTMIIIFGTLVGILLAGGYLFSRVRKQDMDIIRQTNKDLVDDLNRKGGEIRDLKVGMQSLTDRIKHLEVSNKTLEDIFQLALKEYFGEHPEIAVQSKVYN